MAHDNYEGSRVLWVWMKEHSAFKELGNLVVPTTCMFGLEEAGVIIRSQITVFPSHMQGFEGVGGDTSFICISERLLNLWWLCFKKHSTEWIVCNLHLHIFLCTSEHLYFFIFIFKQRSGESVKVHQLDVAIPLHLKSQLRKGPPLGGGEGEAESADTMPFVMLTRKGNKQQVRNCLCIHNC